MIDVKMSNRNKQIFEEDRVVKRCDIVFDLNDNNCITLKDVQLSRCIDIIKDEIGSLEMPHERVIISANNNNKENIKVNVTPWITSA